MRTNEKGVFSIILIVIVVVLIGLVGYLIYQSSQVKQEVSDVVSISDQFKMTDPSPVPSPSINREGTIRFNSELIPLSFEYPSSWGNIEEVLRDGGISGKGYYLTFGGEVGSAALGFGSITAGGRSKDFSEGRGGYIVDAAVGFSSHQEFCDSNFGNQGVDCTKVNPNVITQLVVPKYEHSCPPNPGQYGFSRRVWVNLKGQEIDGFMLQYSGFWSDKFTEMSSQDLDCAKTDETKFNNVVKIIADKLRNGDIDTQTKTNMDGFDAFVRSIKTTNKSS